MLLHHGATEGADVMAARSEAGAPLTARWLLPRSHLRHDRCRRQIGPVVEALEVRLALAANSPTNALPIRPEATGSSHRLGADYQQVVAIQTTTLQSLGESDREVQAAGAQLARRTASAIDELNAELTRIKSQHEADAIAAAIRRDRHLLNLGGADVVRVEQGLDVARGVADQLANTDEADIVNGLLFTNPQLVQQDRSTGTAILRSGKRATNALVRELDRLGDELTSTIPGSPLVKTLVRA
jgi:hypothetical protein